MDKETAGAPATGTQGLGVGCGSLEGETFE